ICRICDRTLDLVGPAEGIRRREDRARRGCAQDRRELPALRKGLRGSRARHSSRLLTDAPHATAMKMRQSLAEWERAFVKEISLDRRTRASLQRTAEQRTHKREIDRRRSEEHTSELQS